MEYARDTWNGKKKQETTNTNEAREHDTVHKLS